MKIKGYKDIGYKEISQFNLHDLELVRTVLRGGSVLDWHRLNITTKEEAFELIRVNELDPLDPLDLEYIESVKAEAIDYLKTVFNFPVPYVIKNASVVDILLLASKKKGHHQLCACILLKVMHIIHHYRGREARKLLPVSDNELFRVVELKVYREVGKLLALHKPVVEFTGSRKDHYSVYTKIMAKDNDIAIQLYDKLRFRIITNTLDDIIPVLNYLLRHLIPFHYVIPGASVNTLVRFKTFCISHSPLDNLFYELGYDTEFEDELLPDIDNKFSHPQYRIVHFVVDMPVRISYLIKDLYGDFAFIDEPVTFAVTEFQICDRESEKLNEIGETSHFKYKERQKKEVEHRLKLGRLLNKPKKI